MRRPRRERAWADLGHTSAPSPRTAAPRSMQLFFEPARRLPQVPFVLARRSVPRPAASVAAMTITFVATVRPPITPRSIASAALTLNMTRARHGRHGYCPSGRLFEAAACGTAIVSDDWEGLDTFFTPGRGDPDRPIRRRCDRRARDRGPWSSRRSPARPRADARRAHRRARVDGAFERILRTSAAGRTTPLGEASRHVDRNHPGRRDGKPHPAAGVLEGAAAGRRRRMDDGHRAARAPSANTWSSA